MKQRQKEAIINLRRENYSYACIANALGLNANTVKSVCLRGGIVPIIENRKTKSEKQNLSICQFCGKALTNDWNRKGKRFCSDKCRTGYWNAVKSKTPPKAAKEAADPVPTPSLSAQPQSPENPPETAQIAPETAGLPGPSELSSEVARR